MATSAITARLELLLADQAGEETSSEADPTSDPAANIDLQARRSSQVSQI